MSSLDRMTLETALPIIQKIYSSIAVKTMIFKENDEWVNLFTLILPTRRTKSDLNDEFINLEQRIGKIDFQNLKIIFQSHDIEVLSKIINEIEKGYLTIGELTTNFMQDTSKIRQERFGRSSYHLRYGELSEYESYSMTSGIQKTVSNVLIEYGVSPRLFGLEDVNDISRSWFQVDAFSYGMTVLILIPVYSKVISILYEGGNTVQIELKIDQDIIKNSKL